jgi:hypothetical protein
MDNLEDAIRERAYHLWVADGRPEGNADNYWLNAQRDMLAQSAGLAVAAETAVVTAKPEKAKVARPKKSRRAA